MFVNNCVNHLEVCKVSHPEEIAANGNLFSMIENNVRLKKVILEPKCSFRNITNNTNEPMDITEIIENMDKQLQERPYLFQ